MLIKNISIFILYSAAFLLSGAVNWPFQLCAISISTLLICWYYLGREKTYKVFITILPSYLLYSFDVVSKSLSHVYPLIIFPPVIVLVCYLLYVQKTSKTRFAYITLLILFTFPTYWGMTVWLQYDSSRPYANQISAPFPQVNMQTTDGIGLDLLKTGDSVVVLDFWTTTCGSCFKEFPHLAQTQKEYANFPVKFYTVNIPLKKDTFQKTIDIIEKYFNQNLFISDTADISKLSIAAVPVFMVIKNNTILYKGHTSASRISMENDLTDEIDRALSAVSKD